MNFDSVCSAHGLKLIGKSCNTMLHHALPRRRKPWPIVLGAGIGIGAGIQNCQNDLKTPFAILPGKIVKVNKDQDS